MFKSYHKKHQKSLKPKYFLNEWNIHQFIPFLNKDLLVHTEIIIYVFYIFEYELVFQI